MKSKARCWVMASLAALACGGGDDPAAGVGAAGSSEMSSEPPPVALPNVRQLRVDLAGTDAAPRIVRARLLEIPGDAVPMPSLVGAAVLVGYAGGGSASVATPFSLPTVLRVERSTDGAQAGEDLPLSEGSVSLYLDARQELSRVDVLGATGAVLASLDAADFEPVEAQGRSCARYRWRARRRRAMCCRARSRRSSF